MDIKPYQAHERITKILLTIFLPTVLISQKILQYEESLPATVPTYREAVGVVGFLIGIVGTALLTMFWVSLVYNLLTL